jgi:hypothetical protein
MDDASAINELRDRLGRAEDRLSRGDGQFTEVLGELQNVTAHLRRQDTMYAELGSKIDDQGKSMAGIVDMWSSGVNATQFFCRLARGWEWIVKQVFSKKFVALAVGYVVIHWAIFNSLPDWTKWAVTLYKLYQGG